MAHTTRTWANISELKHTSTRDQPEVWNPLHECLKGIGFLVPVVTTIIPLCKSETISTLLSRVGAILQVNFKSMTKPVPLLCLLL